MRKRASLLIVESLYYNLYDRGLNATYAFEILPLRTLDFTYDIFFELFRSSNESLEVVTFQIRKTNDFRFEIRR